MNTREESITWNWSGAQVEAESFRRIEAEIGDHGLSPEHWRVGRRMIHTCTDFRLVENLSFHGSPVPAALAALRDGASIYCDSNMIRSGISVPKLKKFNSDYERESIHCYVSDPEVASLAARNNTTRALAAIEKGRPIIDGGIVLIGNAPLALAGICRMIEAGELMPRLVIGMPVGFVNVIESKRWLARTDVPHIVLHGRLGGSPLAVSALHGIMESGL